MAISITYIAVGWNFQLLEIPTKFPKFLSDIILLKISVKYLAFLAHGFKESGC